MLSDLIKLGAIWFHGDDNYYRTYISENNVTHSQTIQASVMGK